MVLVNKEVRSDLGVGLGVLHLPVGHEADPPVRELRLLRIGLSLVGRWVGSWCVCVM